MQASRTEGRAALSRRGVLGAGVVLGLTGFGSVKAAPAGAYALEYFFDAQRTRAAVLSPSGAHIAVMMQLGTPAEPRGVIDVLDASAPEGERRRIELGALTVEALEWANDRRLLARGRQRELCRRTADQGSPRARSETRPSPLLRTAPRARHAAADDPFPY